MINFRSKQPGLMVPIKTNGEIRRIYFEDFGYQTEDEEEIRILRECASAEILRGTRTLWEVGSSDTRTFSGVLTITFEEFPQINLSFNSNSIQEILERLQFQLEIPTGQNSNNFKSFNENPAEEKPGGNPSIYKRHNKAAKVA